MIGGLIKKDLLLLSHRKNAIFFIIALSVMLNVMNGEGFIITYMTFLSLIFSISTMNYDEFDNGFAFLMTLPATRKDYVKEKYIFCISIGCAAAVLATALDTATTLLTGREIRGAADTLGIVVSAIVLGVAAASLMIPVQLKYGQEKSRIALAVTAGFVAVIAFLGSKIPGIADVIRKLSAMSPVTSVLAMLAAGVLITAISCMISISIWGKKEF